MQLRFECNRFDRDIFGDELCEALESDPDRYSENMPYAYFPIEWAEYDSDGLKGGAVEDPLTIYVRLPIYFASEDDDYERPTYRFTLNDLLEDFIEEEPFEKEVFARFIPALEDFLEKIKKAAKDV